MSSLNQNYHSVEDYWTQRLHDVETTDYPRHSYKPATESKSWESFETCFSINKRLTKISSGNEDEIETLLVGSWGYLLSWYTASKDVCFGVQCTVLTQALPFRLSLTSHTQTSEQLLDHVQTLRLQDICYALDTPPATLIPECRYRTLISRYDGKKSDTNLPESVVLTVSYWIEHDDNKILLRAKYSSGEVEKKDVEGVLSTLGYLITSFLNPPCLLSSLTPSKHDLLRLYTINSLPPPLHASNTLLHNLFTSQAARMPSAPALQFQDNKMSYSELDDLSTRIAHNLENIDIMPPNAVPLFFEKGLEMIVAMLGVLKAGACYVPLDIENPPIRLVAILSQLCPAVILTSPGMRARLPALNGVSVIIVSLGTLSLLPRYAPPPHTTVMTSSPAYILPTSGSTGTPKSIVVSHTSITTALQAFLVHFSITSSTRMFAFSSYTSDPSLIEIFMPLAAGGVVCIPSEHERVKDPGAIMGRMKCNVGVFTPTELSLINPSDVPAVKLLIIGGEGLTPTLADTWSGRARLEGVYGRTEACVLSVARTILPIKTTSTPLHNIGTPIGCRVHLVHPSSSHAQLVPLGAVGEIVIEGHTIATGYLSDWCKTEASFIPRPPWAGASDVKNFAEETRFYRTGDLGYMLPHGEIVFVGRRDGQVELNGRRVELGEVEAACRDCAGIRTAVAWVADGRLGAAVVLNDTEEGDSGYSSSSYYTSGKVEYSNVNSNVLPLTGALMSKIDKVRNQIAAAVPAYIVPCVILPVRAIPLLPSGKADRRRLSTLPLPGYIEKTSDNATTTAELLGDRNVLAENQDTLRELWAECLRVPAIAIEPTADFTVLGGDSINAIHLCALARGRGVYLPVEAILRYPALSSQSLHLKSLPSSPLPLLPSLTSLSLPPAPLVNDTSKIAATLSQEFPSIAADAWNFTRTMPSEAAFLLYPDSYPDGVYLNAVARITPLSDTNGLDIPRLQTACQKILDSYPILRRIFVQSPQDGTLVVAVAPAGVLTPDWLQFESLQKAHKWWRKHVAPTTYFGRQLVRFALVKEVEGEGSERWLFSLGIHHALYDAMMLHNLARSIRRAYLSPKLSLPQSLPYDAYLQNADGLYDDAAKEYWRNLLAGSKLCDITNPSGAVLVNKRVRAQYLKTRIPTRGLQVGAAAAVYAAWAVALGRSCTVPRDVVFGTIVSGRGVDIAGVEAVMGSTVNLIPFRVQLGGEDLKGKGKGDSYGDLVSRVREQMISGVKYESTPIDKMMAECTDWVIPPTPGGRIFSSLVHYRNISLHFFDDYDDDFTNDGNDDEYVMGWETAVNIIHRGEYCDGTDVYVCATSSNNEGAQGLEVELWWNPKTVARETAEQLLADLSGGIAATRGSGLDKKIS